MATVALLGTCDTKLQELLYLRSQITKHHPNISVLLIDAGHRAVDHEAITLSLPRALAQDANDPAELPRAEFIQAMSTSATSAVKGLFDKGTIHGVIGAGGSCGTSIATAAMRDALPVGFPKLVVSTVASGDTGHLVGETDIALMYSVVDVAGLNDVLCDVLANAAASIGGAALAYAARKRTQEQQSSNSSNTAGKKRLRVGTTMFGVTTPGVDAIRHHLESSYPGAVEVYVFHATGHGGKAMERLVRERRLDAVLDLTTTELCDLVTGGVMSAGPNRLEAAAQAGIPYVLSLGATDMTNFGPRDSVPEKYHDRKLYEHNPEVTLMRSSVDECREVGRFIVEKLRGHAKDPSMVEVWLPKGGVSKMSVPGGPFEDREADAALFDAVQSGLEGSGIRVVDDSRDVNDPQFAKDIAEALAAKMGLTNEGQ